jgi:hypothetical protein
MTPHVLAILISVIGVPLNWYVVWRLWRLPSRKTNRVIRERAIAALALAIVVTVFAAIFLNNDMLPPLLGLDVTKWVTRCVLLVASFVPPLYWLSLYRSIK